MPTDDRMPTETSAPRDVLAFWRLVELFSPQRVESPGRGDERRQVVSWSPGRPLPWDTLPTPRPSGRNRLVWQHTVFLGVYPIDGVYEHLHTVFPQDLDAFDERVGGHSACAALVVDDRGALVPTSPTLSSALWGLGRLRVPDADPSALTGFGDAQELFATSVVEHVADARAALGADESPRVDEPMMTALRSLAHAAAGVVGMNRVWTADITVTSTQVRADRAQDLPDFDFLNSFVLKDLGTVAGSPLSPALATYLTHDRDLATDRRVDVRRHPGAVVDGTRIEHLPLGRWPSDPSHPLASSQQFAVNLALGAPDEPSGLIGVNGPPGTGKTTMLRDLVAGNVVRRAEALASLSHPDSAYTSTVHTWKSGDYPRRIKQLKDELTGFEMLVASSNNAAVENVSDELPQRKAIDSCFSTADYFGDLATEISRRSTTSDSGPPQAWGLLAARLGNSRNRSAFNSAFWFGTGAQDQPHDPSVGVVHGMQQRLKNWEKQPTTRPSWSGARAAFERARTTVDELVSERTAAARRITRRAEVSSEIARTEREVGDLRTAADEAAADRAVLAGRLVRLRQATADHLTRRQRHLETRPGLLEIVFSWGRVSREWRAALRPIDDELRGAESREHAATADLGAIDERATRVAIDLTARTDALARLTTEHERLVTTTTADAARYGPTYPGPSWLADDTARELHGAWLDRDLNAARSRLFLAALDLHRAFLANASGARQGLQAALDVVTGAAPRALGADVRRAAWQTFFLVVPLVSTTFASVGTMLRGLDAEALGWLLVDEAGQATPQSAVGAIWRSRRVVAVGDPLQLTPIVSIPNRAQHDLAQHFRVSSTWVPSSTSVQVLADRVGRFGTTIASGREPVWVSAPLRVHRRCGAPMFEISNEIAYEGLMIDGVVGRKALDAPPSQWIDTPDPRPGSHLQVAEIDALRSRLGHLNALGIPSSSIIAISPFRAVADRLRRVAEDFPGLRGGTIHTAQGREASVVFLVLGGDPQRPGAVRWAASSPNLVNVAASRAKDRLYVIGDHGRWSTAPYFETLARLLPTSGRPAQAASGSGRAGAS